jgi:hypothetical protein
MAEVSISDRNFFSVGEFDMRAPHESRDEMMHALFTNEKVCPAQMRTLSMLTLLHQQMYIHLLCGAGYG